VPDLLASSDTGSSNTDNKTSVADMSFSVSLDGTGSTPGTVLELWAQNRVIASKTLTATDLLSPTVVITLDPAVSKLVNGTVDIASKLSYSLSGGQTLSSSLSSPLQVTLNSALMTPTLTFDMTDDTGVSVTDGVTNKMSNLTFKVKADPNATVTLMEGGTQLGTKVANASGEAMFDLAYQSGTHTLVAKSSDPLFGLTSSNSAAVSITVDSVAPSVNVGASQVPMASVYNLDATLNFILNFRKYVGDDSKNPIYFQSVRGVGYKIEV
jgi:hypothetical protein